MNKYKPVIGLEIHVELSTKSKMFCQCSADYFGKDPNTNTCPVCLGLPGALPVPNKKAVESCIKIGKALGCKINTVTKFDRKHYFYPDLPKGYQITQYDQPIAVNGRVQLNGEKYGITRVHQEEDTGKLTHSGTESLVDFNRSGVPLIEIVTDPDFSNSEDVKRFLEELQIIIRYLEVSDADMEKGSMRLEPNISLWEVKSQKSKVKRELPNYKVEVKNINSFKFVQKAIEYEIKRQTELLENGETPIQETRGFDENKMKTVSQRTKEEAHDYRYFPEPDIPPMTLDQKYIDSIAVPELPALKMQRYVSDLSLREQDAFQLTRDRSLAEYFESILTQTKISPQKIANLIVNKKIPHTLRVRDFIARSVELLRPEDTDVDALKRATDMVIKNNQSAVLNYKSGKESVIMFLVGQVMREMKGKADPQLVLKELIAKLTSNQ